MPNKSIDYITIAKKGTVLDRNNPAPAVNYIEQFSRYTGGFSHEVVDLRTRLADHIEKVTLHRLTLKEPSKSFEGLVVIVYGFTRAEAMRLCRNILLELNTSNRISGLHVRDNEVAFLINERNKEVFDRLIAPSQTQH